jgi:hypothetical protein
MWIVALLSLLAATPGHLAPEPDPRSPGAELDRPADPRDPCDREGWVGDGAGGRDPPACDGDSDGADAGLEASGWLGRDEDGDDEDRARYER